MTLRISLTPERAIQIFELVFAITGILFFTESLHKPLGGLNTLVRYGTFVTSGGLILMRWQMSVYALKGEPFVIALNILAFISFGWSEVPDETTVAVREILYMSSFGLYLATRYTLRELVILLCWGLEISAVINSFYAIAKPSIGLHHDKFAGLWKGIYSHKNDLSAYMTLSGAAHLILLFDKNYNRLWAAGGLGLSIFVILMSGSKSGLVNIIALVAALFLFRTIRWRNLVMIMLFSTIIGVSLPVGTVFFSNWDNIMNGLGKDPTLSGRTEIWGYAIPQVVEKRPWFGFGRAAFWSKKLNYRNEAGIAVVGTTPVNLLSGTYAPPHSHNGFVDTFVDVGFVGLGLFFLSFFLLIIRTVKRVYITDTPEDFWPLIFLIFCFMYNMTESLIMRGENVFWVYYIATAYSVRMGGQEALDDRPSIRQQALEQVVPLAGRRPKKLPALSRR